MNDGCGKKERMMASEKVSTASGSWDSRGRRLMNSSCCFHRLSYDNLLSEKKLRVECYVNAKRTKESMEQSGKMLHSSTAVEINSATFSFASSSPYDGRLTVTYRNIAKIKLSIHQHHISM